MNEALLKNLATRKATAEAYLREVVLKGLLRGRVLETQILETAEGQAAVFWRDVEGRGEPIPAELVARMVTEGALRPLADAGRFELAPDVRALLDAHPGHPTGS